MKLCFQLIFKIQIGGGRSYVLALDMFPAAKRTCQAHLEEKNDFFLVCVGSKDLSVEQSLNFKRKDFRWY